MFRLSRYHVSVVFLMAGVFTVILAYATLNLFHVTMANLQFLRSYGLVAVQEGALVQFAQIVICAVIALFSYIGFKICESELVQRYHRWQDR